MLELGMCQAAFVSTYMVCTLRARSTACYTVSSFFHHLSTTNLHHECTAHNLNHHASQACYWYPVSTWYWFVGIHIPKPIVEHAVIKWGTSVDGYQDYSANHRKSSGETIAVSAQGTMLNPQGNYVFSIFSMLAPTTYVCICNDNPPLDSKFSIPLRLSLGIWPWNRHSQVTIGYLQTHVILSQKRTRETKYWLPWYQSV